MKRYSSAPCLADRNNDSKKAKPMKEPNAKEYLQLALARILELQREIKDGTYTTDYTSDLGESSSEEDLTNEILRKVFENLPGTPDSVETIMNRVTNSKLNKPQLDAIHGKRIQLLGYDTCRRATVGFMKNVLRETKWDVNSKSSQSNYSGFRLGIYSRNEPRVAHCRTGLWKSTSSHDQEIQDRMLRSLDLHLASKQRDYTAKLMQSGV
uniref:uncharacterized protein LOC117153170 n=1 Tax=Bombus vancouverensis nearcticus TaxID=2705178 RepID=UPI00143C1A7D|nr:uncharacterized protein LOC117153170 [Bombus vancouverensis nearcticus]